MTTKYTDSLEFNSTAVQEAFYNKNTSELSVVLTSGYGYTYKNVPETVWHQMKNASSVGSFYAHSIKRNYGPSKYLGFVPNTEDEFERVYTDVQESVTSSHSDAIVSPNQLRSAVGSPQALVYRGENMSITAPAAQRSDYTVAFEYAGKVREHKVQASSVDEAIVFVQTFAEMLDLDFKIKAVTVYFD